MLGLTILFPFVFAFDNDLLEALTLDVLPNQLLKLDDVRLFLGLGTPPKRLQVPMSFRIGEVLVVAPQAVQSATQVVNQVVVVICHSKRLAQVDVFTLCSFRHGKILPFQLNRSAKKADVAGPSSVPTRRLTR